MVEVYACRLGTSDPHEHLKLVGKIKDIGLGYMKFDLTRSLPIHGTLSIFNPCGIHLLQTASTSFLGLSAVDNPRTIASQSEINDSIKEPDDNSATTQKSSIDYIVECNGAEVEYLMKRHGQKAKIVLGLEGHKFQDETYGIISYVSISILSSYSSFSSPLGVIVICVGQRPGDLSTLFPVANFPTLKRMKDVPAECSNVYETVLRYVYEFL